MNKNRWLFHVLFNIQNDWIVRGLCILQSWCIYPYSHEWIIKVFHCMQIKHRLCNALLIRLQNCSFLAKQPLKCRFKPGIAMLNCVLKASPHLFCLAKQEECVVSTQNHLYTMHFCGHCSNTYNIAMPFDKCMEPIMSK